MIKSVPTAKSILSSRHALSGKTIHTLLVRMPRCILAEWNTHRQLSRNAASSRAIPVSKMIQQVVDDPFIPLVWGKNQKGMQADVECNMRVKVWDNSEDSFVEVSNEEAWLHARDMTVEIAEGFSDAGYHKQIVNRLLEPWMWTYVVVTATEWSNFLAVRAHKDAEPHFEMLARAIKVAIDGAKIQTLEPGQWHLPFTDHDPKLAMARLTQLDFIKLSVARCASTSYKTVDGFDMTIERASELYDKLRTANPMHPSPFEHQAQMSGGTKIGNYVKWHDIHDLNGNFSEGFIQYRKTLPNECL